MTSPLVSKLVHASTTATYRYAYYGFTAYPFFAFPGSLLMNAPFGRFAWHDSVLSFNGNFGWWLMEIISPICFLACLVGRPLSNTPVTTVQDFSIEQGWKRFLDLSAPTQILVGLYLIHYANRSTISCLRTPQPRSPTHVMTFLAGVVFNVMNGSILGTWLGGRTLPTTLGNEGAVPTAALQMPLYWVGIGLWTIGFLGNLYHDEILYNLRRPDKDGKKPPRYSIPHGGLYSFPFGGISAPAYLSEWLEWLGFCLACSTIAPPPALPLFDTSTTASKETMSVLYETVKVLLVRLATVVSNFIPPVKKFIQTHPTHPLALQATYFTPPWLFFYNEIAAMLPRALRSHAWYKQKFGQQFPKNRKAIIPGIL